MASLTVRDIQKIGIGWTDTPVLIYPAAVQGDLVQSIIEQRGTFGDSRATSGDADDVSEMLHESLNFNRRWDYIIPENLVKVEMDPLSEFKPVQLFFEEFTYDPDILPALPFTDDDVLQFDTPAERDLAAQHLVLANRVNELRRICELNLHHVHKVHFVYEDESGYAFSGKDDFALYKKKGKRRHGFGGRRYSWKKFAVRNRNGEGGQTNMREYIGAISSKEEFLGNSIIQRGVHYVDYTMPPEFDAGKAFSPEMFTGLKLENTGRTTSHHVPAIWRVFPDLTPGWLSSVPLAIRGDVADNWNLTVPDSVAPTPVRAEHINELRKAMGAYSTHTHKLVLQSVDFKTVDGVNNPDGTEGTAFDIDPQYVDTQPPQYLLDLITELDEAAIFGFVC